MVVQRKLGRAQGGIGVYVWLVVVGVLPAITDRSYLRLGPVEFGGARRDLSTVER